MPELLHPGVYVREVSSGVRPIEGVSTSTAAFVGVADKGPIPGTKLPNGRMADAVMVTSLTEYFRRFGGYRKDSFLTYAVKAFYDNGGRRLYIVRVAPTKLDSTTTPAKKILTAKIATNVLDGVKVSAANEGVWGNNLWVDADASPDPNPDPQKPTRFKLVVYVGASPEEAVGNLVESFDNLDIASDSPFYFKTIINSRSEYIAITNDPALPADKVTSIPKKQLVRTADGKITTPPVRLKDGTDGFEDATASVDFIGQPAVSDSVTGTGLNALDKVTDVNLVAIPGQGDSATVGKGMGYCKNRALRDCFFIGDMGAFPSVATARVPGATPDKMTGVTNAVDYTKNNDLNRPAGDFGAIYFPWIQSSDPIGNGSNPRIMIPPSGFVAGIYARVDNTRGVFKAPAGITDSGVNGALGLSSYVSDTEQDRLNPIGVNVIRVAPAGGGIVVWGTRTIGVDAEWRYIPVRRMAIFLRVSIYYGIQWAVFEPNDEPLWAALRINIRSFMLTQFRAGAFQGRTPNEAFFVKCDASTTTQQDIDNGVVNILVGFAPLKPAEFVVLTLTQKVNQPAA